MYKIISLLALLLNASFTDLNEFLNIKSKEAIIAYNDNNITFSNNVEIIFKDIKILADKVIINYRVKSNTNLDKKNNLIQHIKKAKLINNITLITPNMHITGNEAEFDNNKITFKGNVSIKHDAGVISGNNIVYDIEKKEILIYNAQIKKDAISEEHMQKLQKKSGNN